MKTARDWLRAKWGELSLREVAELVGTNQQSVRQWALGLAAPTLAGCRKLSAAMAREGLVMAPEDIYRETSLFTVTKREKMRAGLDEAAQIKETEAEDNTPGSDTISGAR
jgi:transcriptional regulator with XRE-family HTH domain